MLPKVRAALAGIKNAVVIVINPPPVQGLGAPVASSSWSRIGAITHRRN